MVEDYNRYSGSPIGNEEDPFRSNTAMPVTDYGPFPFVIDIYKATVGNDTFRTSLWTGDHLQLTLMSIPAGGEIGLEVHPNIDQFLRIESGNGLLQIGDRKDHLYLQQPLFDDFVVFIPAGYWHNVLNVGDQPLKLYAIYAPPEHPWNTVQETKAIAEAAKPHQ